MSGGDWSFLLRFRESVFHRYFSDRKDVRRFKQRLRVELETYFPLLWRNAFGEIYAPSWAFKIAFSYGWEQKGLEQVSVECRVSVPVFDRLPCFLQRHGLCAMLEFTRWYILTERMPAVLHLGHGETRRDLLYDACTVRYNELYHGIKVVQL